jgi:hypothetical protein
MSQFGTFSIDGKSYDLDDFELGDLEEVEELCQRQAQLPDGTLVSEPTPFGELNFNATKVLRAFAFVILRRDNPEFTYEDTRSIKLVSFTEGEEDIPETGPPDGTETTSRPNDSKPVVSGLPASVTPLPG